MNIGENIQYIRKFYGWTQKELAEKIGKAESSIRKYEANMINIPLSVVDDLAKVFEVTREDLLGSIDNLRHSLAIKDFQDNFHEKSNDIKYILTYNKKLNKLMKFTSNNVNSEKEYDCTGYPIEDEVEYDVDLNKILGNSTTKQIIEVKEQDTPFSTTARGWIETPKEINPNILHEALNTLLIYANKCSTPILTDTQRDMIFDKVMDYIKFQLYQLGRE